MDFLQLAAQRRSIRSYQNRPVDRTVVTQVLEAARIAPSAKNLQPWKVIVVQDEQVSLLKPAYDREWFLSAPVVIAMCEDRNACWVRNDGMSFGAVDCAIAMQQIVLAATERDLGTCWIGAFNAEALSLILKLPDHITPVAMTPLGYIKALGEPRPRKSLDEIVQWGIE
jgi:nitroreductase